MKSRMNREVHVRFRERFRGETPLYLLDNIKEQLIYIGCNTDNKIYFLSINLIISLDLYK